MKNGNKTTAPLKNYLAAVNRFAERVPVRALFDNGRVKTLAADSAEGLFSGSLTATTPTNLAQRFLSDPDISNSLGLRFVKLSPEAIVEDSPLGHRVTYRQEIVTPSGRRLPVCDGWLDMTMTPEGTIVQLNSALKQGSLSPKIDLEGLISEQDAILAARKHLGWGNWDDAVNPRSELMVRARNKRLQPVYELIVSSDSPRRSAAVVVNARSGKVMETRPLTRYFRTPTHLPPVSTKAPKSVEDAVLRSFTGSRALPGLAGLAGTLAKGKTNGNSSVKGKSFLRIPDVVPDKQLIKQVYNIILQSLPDPKVLANQFFEVHVGNRRQPVQAISDGSANDGTFNYEPNSPEFSAVVTFFVLNIQWRLMMDWGMKAPGHTIKVIVEDKTVTDNALFDQASLEIRIGVGTGVRNGGLTRYIAYDIGVTLHENGHHLVSIVTPGGDLLGTEGEAIHEAVGDVQGTLVINWWFRLKFSKQLGVVITVTDIENDDRIIGSFAMPPMGIRQQKNSAKGPLVGEPHDDALIVGGAMADLLVEMVKAENDVEKGLAGFGKLTIAALGLMPRGTVKFRDLLNAYISADQTLNGGNNKQKIVQAFNDHNISLTGGKGRRGTPVIIIT